MSGEFDSRKYSYLTKFKRRPQIFVKLNFRELYDSKLSLVYILLIIWSQFIEFKTGQNQKGRLQVQETPILKLIFVTLTEVTHLL